MYGPKAVRGAAMARADVEAGLSMNVNGSDADIQVDVDSVGQDSSAVHRLMQSQEHAHRAAVAVSPDHLAHALRDVAAALLRHLRDRQSRHAFVPTEHFLLLSEQMLPLLQVSRDSAANRRGPSIKVCLCLSDCLSVCALVLVHFQLPMTGVVWSC
jgi:hypothetical protein